MPPRSLIRTAHIVGGVFLLIFLWTDVRTTDGWLLVVARATVTALVVSGAVMWPLPRLLAKRRARKRQALG